MVPHEEFLELCAAATAGELTADERAKLDAHLAVCKECREASAEFEMPRRMERRHWRANLIVTK